MAVVICIRLSSSRCSGVPLFIQSECLSAVSYVPVPSIHWMLLSRLREPSSASPAHARTFSDGTWTESFDGPLGAVYRVFLRVTHYVCGCRISLENLLPQTCTYLGVARSYPRILGSKKHSHLSVLVACSLNAYQD
jgi:hypothetical protein